MTKLRKRLALLLVLVMAMSTLNLPTAAAEPEEVEPCAVVVQCEKCNGSVRYLGERVFYGIVGCNTFMDQCEFPAVHNHETEEVYELYSCDDCGYEYKRNHRLYENCTMMNLSVWIFWHNVCNCT